MNPNANFLKEADQITEKWVKNGLIDRLGLPLDFMLKSDRLMNESESDMKTEQQIQRSKFLSKHLRHDPQGLGLTLQPGGWVNVDDLLASTKVKSMGITYDELLDIVESCEKQRFAMDATGDRIRANQGHSVEVDLQLEAKEPPKFLYHGTVEKFIPAIMAEGLSKQTRHHVHLSKNLETSIKVGARRGKPVILLVDSEKMHSLGHKFYESQNGVWLTDIVPSEFITKMV